MVANLQEFMDSLEFHAIQVLREKGIVVSQLFCPDNEELKI